jgi:hypothetical protein
MGSGYSAFPGGSSGGKPEFEIQDVAEGKPSGGVQPGNKAEAYGSGTGARATSSYESGGSSDGGFVYGRLRGDPPSGVSSPGSVIDEVIASYREAAASGGYSSEAFDYSDIISTSDPDTQNISEAFDDILLPNSVDFASFTNPLLDLGVDPSIPAIISSFTYFAPKGSSSMTYGERWGEGTGYDGGDVELFDIANDSVANFIKSSKNFYIVNASDIDRVSQFITGNLTTAYEPWIEGWGVSGGSSVNHESKPALQMDMFFAQYDPTYADVVGATWATEGYNAFDRSMYEATGDSWSDFSYVHRTPLNIAPETSINLPLTQINYVQPYIAKELFLSAKSWVEIKKLIEHASRLRSEAQPYFIQHKQDIEAASGSTLGGIRSSYRWASLNKIVPSKGYRYYTDGSNLSKYFIELMRDRLGTSSFGDPINEIYKNTLCFKDDELENQTPTKLYSQFAYDLYKTVKDGSYYFTQPSNGARHREQWSGSRLQPEKGYYTEKSSGLIASMLSISGTSVSDDEIGDFIESMPATESGIAAIFGLLGRDYIQNIAMNNSVFTKSFNSIVGYLLSTSGIGDSMSADEIESLTFNDSTTIESLFDVVFGAASGISIESPPPPFSIMSPVIKKYNVGTVLPIESFCSNSADTDPEIYTSGYEYFVEELIAAVESKEEMIPGSELYDYFGTSEEDIPKSSTSNTPGENTTAAYGYAPGFGWTGTGDSPTLLPNQVLGDRPITILSSLTSLCLQHLTLNRAFSTISLGDDLSQDTCRKVDIKEFVPTTGFLYHSLMHKIADISATVLEQFNGIGTDSATFLYNTASTKRSMELCMLGYIAAGTTALKASYVRYSEELYKAKLANTLGGFGSGRFEDGSAELISVDTRAGAASTRNTFDDEWTGALNSLQSQNSDFVYACELLAAELLDSFSPKDGLDHADDGDHGGYGGGPFGDFSMDGTDPLVKFKTNFTVNIEIEDATGVFNGVLLTPTGTALVEAVFDSESLLGIVSEAVISGDTNMKLYASDTTTIAEPSGAVVELAIKEFPGLISSTSLTGPAVDLLSPTSSDGILNLSTSDVYGFNALTYIRSMSVAYIDIINDTIGEYNFDIATDLASSDFIGESASSSTGFLDDQLISIEINTPSFHSFFLGAYYAAGRSTRVAQSSSDDGFFYNNSVIAGGGYDVSTLQQSRWDDPARGVDETGESHFITPTHENMFYETFYEAFFYPGLIINHEDVIMLELYNSLLHISNHWGNIGKNIQKPNGLENQCTWKKWLQFGAFNGCTRHLGLLASTESIKLMKHNIREFMSYGINSNQRDESGSGWIGDYDHSTANLPHTYPMGSKITTHSVSLLNRVLNGYGWPSGNQTYGGEVVNMGTDPLSRPFIGGDKKIITVGLPAGFTDMMRRQAHNMKPPSASIYKKHRGSTIRISIYKYDLENDSICYPEPMSFIVNTSLFSPTAFPDITADWLLGDGGSDKNLSSRGTVPYGYFWDIPSLIGDPDQNRILLDGSSSGGLAPKCFSSKRAYASQKIGTSAMITSKSIPASYRNGGVVEGYSTSFGTGVYTGASMAAFPTVGTPDMLWRITAAGGGLSADTDAFGYYSGGWCTLPEDYYQWPDGNDDLFKQVPIHYYAAGDVGSFIGGGYGDTVSGKLIQYAWDQETHSFNCPFTYTQGGNIVTGGVMIGVSQDGTIRSWQNEARDLDITRWETDSNSSHRSQAAINCTKDRILKEYMRLFAGVDMREVGFPAFQQDTDYRACTDYSSRPPPHSNRTSRPCDIMSSSSTAALKSKSSPTMLYLSPGFLGAFLNFQWDTIPAAVSGGFTASGLWGSMMGQPIPSACSPGEPLLPPIDLSAGQNWSQATEYMGTRSGNWNNPDYLDYAKLKSKTVTALHSYFMADHYAGGIAASITSDNAWKRVQSMFPGYELGAPVSRSIATLPNKFERTFSFLIDHIDDFDAHRIVASEFDTFTVPAPDHESNLFGFYATIELLDS